MEMPSLGVLGWWAFLAFAAGGIVRLLKADTLNSLLAKWNIPPIPKVALPWIALVLGFVGNGAKAMSEGKSLSDAALLGLWGLLIGAVPIAGHEMMEKPTRAALGHKTGDVVFGKKTVPVEVSNDNGVAA